MFGFKLPQDIAKRSINCLGRIVLRRGNGWTIRRRGLNRSLRFGLGRSLSQQLSVLLDYGGVLFRGHGGGLGGLGSFQRIHGEKLVVAYIVAQRGG
jgi:hypothetical protein